MSKVTKSSNNHKNTAPKPAPASVAKPAKTEPEAPTKEPAPAADPAPVEVAPVEVPKPARKARKDAPAPQVTELKIALLELEGGTQSRATLNKVTIIEYAEQMTAGVEFPPVVVFFDGEAHWLADGFHRTHAAIKAGRKRIACEIHEGSQRDAILFSAGANSAHGLRRTNADKEHAVRLLLADPEWKNASDRWLADKVGVGHPFVAKVRSQLESDSSSSAPRIGQDGKARALPKAKKTEQASIVAEVPADEATALAELQNELERRLAGWTWAPHALASLLESCATKARAQLVTKEAVNG
ncbi:MAG TPA: hypothetical protein VFK05_19220 [Polyangiaceae bacterium]|nr:hypothetical protein [Polyangiaceae bacterium]